jgi:hypothetical protein
LPELVVVALLLSATTRRGEGVTALRGANRRYHSALWNHVPRTTADRNCQSPRTRSWTPVTCANANRGNQLCDGLRVGMGGHRSFEPTALPELEGAEGG